MLRIKEKELVPVNDWKQLYIGKEAYIKGKVKKMVINETCTASYIIVNFSFDNKDHSHSEQIFIDPDYLFVEEEDKDD